MKRYNRFWGGEWHFVPDDEWDGLLLKAHGRLYLTDWGKWEDLGPDFLSEVPDIEVSQIIPEGGCKAVGVLGESGIFEVITHKTNGSAGFRAEIIEHANWDEIEILPLWEESEE